MQNRSSPCCDKATLAEIAHRLGRKALEEVAATAMPDTILGVLRFISSGRRKEKLVTGFCESQTIISRNPCGASRCDRQGALRHDSDLTVKRTRIKPCENRYFAEHLTA